VKALRYDWKELKPGLLNIFWNPDEIGNVLHGAPQVTVLPGSFKFSG
jgi:hypothetical protein